MIYICNDIYIFQIKSTISFAYECSENIIHYYDKNMTYVLQKIIIVNKNIIKLSTVEPHYNNNFGQSIWIYGYGYTLFSNKGTSCHVAIVNYDSKIGIYNM